LIIHGKHDLFFSYRRALEMHNLIPNSQLKILETNHIPIISIPEEINSLILNFLNSSKFHKDLLIV